MKSLYEQLGGTYHESEDGLLYPNLLPSAEDEPHYGKYSRTRRTYPKEHRPILYTSRVFSGKLNTHLNKIDNTAKTLESAGLASTVHKYDKSIIPVMCLKT
jgi:hypothetical protein